MVLSISTVALVFIAELNASKLLCFCSNEDLSPLVIQDDMVPGTTTGGMGSGPDAGVLLLEQFEFKDNNAADKNTAGINLVKRMVLLIIGF